MASDTTLSAAFKASGDLVKTLEAIEGAADDVADSFDEASDEGEDLSDTIEAITGAAESLNEVLQETAEVSGVTATASKALANAIDEVGDQAEESMAQLAGYVGVVSALGGASGFAALAGSGSVNFERDIFDIGETQQQTLGDYDFAGDFEGGEGVSEEDLTDLYDQMFGDMDIPSEMLGIPPEDSATTQASLGDFSDAFDADEVIGFVEALDTDEVDSFIEALDEGEVESFVGDFEEDEVESFIGVLDEGEGEVTAFIEALDAGEVRDFIESLDESVAGGGGEGEGEAGRVASTAATVANAVPKVNVDDDTFTLGIGSLIPDMPDISGIPDTIKDIGGALGQIGGAAPQIAGLSKLAGTLARLAGLGGAAATLSSVATALGGFVVIGSILGGITALIGALGGLTTAAVGVGAAFAGIFGSALYEKGKQIAQQSEDVKTAWEGAAKYIKSFKDDMREALQPLMALDTASILEGAINSVLQSARDYATMVSSVFPSLQKGFNKIKATWDATSPEIFAQLEKTIRAFMPMITGFVQWLIKSIPEAIAYMREMGLRLLPDLVDMFSAWWGVLKPFLHIGPPLIEILLDIGTLLGELLAPFMQIAALVLTPVLEGVAWAFSQLVSVVKWVSDAVSGFLSRLLKIEEAFMSAIANLNIRKIGALFWNMVIGAFIWLTNAVIKGIEFLYNKAMKALENSPVGGAYDFAASVGDTISLGADELIAQHTGNMSFGLPGHIDLETLNQGQTVREGGLKVDLRPEQPGGQTRIIQPRDKGVNVTKYETNTSVTFPTASTSGYTSEAQITRIVRRAIREERNTGRQQNYPNA